MVEQEDWQRKFGEAATALKDEREKMLNRGVYVDPESIYVWAMETTKMLMGISPIFSGGQVALLVCDEIDKKGERFLEGIIEYGRAKGIVSRVDTTSKRYTATIVLSTYLDRELLGKD